MGYAIMAHTHDNQAGLTGTEAYIWSIRKADKRAFAQRYWRAMQAQASNRLDVHYDCSYKDAREVRLRLESLHPELSLPF